MEISPVKVTVYLLTFERPQDLETSKKFCLHKAIYEDEFIRHIRFRKPVVIKIDGKKKIGVVMKM